MPGNLLTAENLLSDSNSCPVVFLIPVPCSEVCINQSPTPNRPSPTCLRRRRKKCTAQQLDALPPRQVSSQPLLAKPSSRTCKVLSSAYCHYVEMGHYPAPPRQALGLNGILWQFCFCVCMFHSFLHFPFAYPLWFD